MNEDFPDVEYGRVARGTKHPDGSVATCDSSGNIATFCEALASRMREVHEERVTFALGKRVCGWERDGNVVKAVKVVDDQVSAVSRQSLGLVLTNAE